MLASRTNPKSISMREIQPDQYKALLNFCGLTVRDLELPGGLIRPAFQVLEGEDMPLGTVFCHSSNSIPIKQAIEMNTQFLDELRRYVGIRNARYNAVAENILKLNNRLRQLDEQEET